MGAAERFFFPQKRLFFILVCLRIEAPWWWKKIYFFLFCFKADPNVLLLFFIWKAKRHWEWEWERGKHTTHITCTLTERERVQTQAMPTCWFTPNACNSWDGARLMAGNSIHVFHMDARDPRTYAFTAALKGFHLKKAEIGNRTRTETQPLPEAMRAYQEVCVI